MTKQEIFNKVKTHLLTQNKRSTLSGGSCLYRTKNGLKCAVGCLIPDDIYNPSFEGNTISSLLINGGNDEELVKLRELFSSIDTDFLRSIQKIHDQYEPEDWEHKLIEFAERNELNYDG